MDNEWDNGLQEDFDNMTYDLGREVLVFPKKIHLDYAGQEDTDSGIQDTYAEGKTEVVFIQELDTQHETIKSGVMAVGDVRFTFLSNSIIEEEGFVFTNSKWYKVIQLTKVNGMSNDAILYIKAFGKKVPYR